MINGKMNDELGNGRVHWLGEGRGEHRHRSTRPEAEDGEGCNDEIGRLLYAASRHHT